MTTERMMDLAERLAEGERDAAIDTARAQLIGAGCKECIDCGEPIEHQRRVAMPNATRCIECQGFFEDRKRNGRN